MTTPIERTRSILYTRELLFALLDPKQTPRVPREIRRRARDCLRHYPGSSDLAVSCRALPHTWGKVEI